MASENMKVGTKLGLGFGTLLVLLLVVSALGIVELKSTATAMDSIGNDRYPKIALINGIIVRTLDNTRLLRNALLVSDPALIEQNIQKAENHRKENTADLEKLGKMLNSPKGKELFKAILDRRQALGEKYSEYYSLLKQDKSQATDSLLKTFAPANDGFLKALDDLAKFQAELMAKSVSDGQNTYENARNLIMALSVGALILGIVLALSITRGLLKQLGGEPAYAAEITQRISQGDLAVDVQVQPGDNSSLLACMRTMQEQLHSMVQLVLTNAGQLTEAASHLASSAQQVSVSSQNQSEAAASMASAVEELTVSFDQVSNNANEAQAIAKHSGELSVQGGTVVHGAVAEMNKIAESVNQSAQLIQTLGEHSGKISAIVSVIKDIADQTNLLALNAAIEAARAGEQGRGFAVVADEVRKLAERTTQSTQEISDMIGTIQSGTQNAIASMEEGSNRVRDGVEMANRAGDSMSQISDGANKVVSEVNDITASLREQTAASTQVAMNVEKIAQMTEENSAAVGEIASAAQHLEELAGQLQGAVSRFKV